MNEITAAGILFIAGGRVLVMRRAPYADDHAQFWDLPGGKAEPGESTEITALRECLEETGFVPTGPITFLASTTYENVNFTTYAKPMSEVFVPALNDEHTEYTWLGLGEIPPVGLLHPGVAEVLAMPQTVALQAQQMTELDVARAIALGALDSPQKFGNMTLFSLRVTGTGTAFRDRYNEYVYRSPDNYMTPEFLARCSGLPVVWLHPKDDKLNSKEFSDRVVGAVMHAYLVPELSEVWAVARVYDDDAIRYMSDKENPLSTSPGFLFRKGETDEIKTEAGETLFIEGKSFLLDHLAVCPLGVWDKGGSPAGVNLKIDEVNIMEENENKGAGEQTARADSTAPDMGAMMSRLDSVMSRVDACMTRMDAADADAAKARADAADAEKARADAAAADADKGEKARADAAESTNAELRDRLARMEAMLSAPAPEAQAAMSEVQARADSVASAYGEQAPRPLQGETVLAYRRRMVGKYLDKCPMFKGTDLSGLAEGALFDTIETRVYADALREAERPSNLAPGVMIERQRRDETGRTIKEFSGAMTWLDTFRGPSRSLFRLNNPAA